jgi:hypothetical protein
MSNTQMDTLPQPLSGDHTLNFSQPSANVSHAHEDKKDVIPSSEAIAADVAVDNINAIEFGNEGKTRSDRAARAGMEQNYLIPTAGDEDVTTKWEKYMFMIFRAYSSARFLTPTFHLFLSMADTLDRHVGGRHRHQLVWWCKEPSLPQRRLPIWQNAFCGQRDSRWAEPHSDCMTKPVVLTRRCDLQ